MFRSLRLLLPSLVIVFLASAMLFFGRTSANTPAVDPGKSQRSFIFIYQVHVPPDADAKTMHLWIPLPQNDAYQSVSDMKIESAVPHTESHDPEYKNPFAVFTPTAAQAAAGYDVTLTFRATRREHLVDVHAPAMQTAAATPRRGGATSSHNGVNTVTGGLAGQPVRCRSWWGTHVGPHGDERPRAG